MKKNTIISRVASFLSTGKVLLFSVSLSFVQFASVGNVAFAESTLPTPLVKLGFNENSGLVVGNTGSTGLLHSSFNKTIPPAWSTNTPVSGLNSSVDFGEDDGNYFVESPLVIGELAGLENFTVTGWVNNRSSETGSGGNRIVCWMNNSNDGVDIVYTADGALRVGIDEWAEDGPVVSSPGKIPTNSSAPASNWRFFAVTYESSSSSLKIYFGCNTTSASLDRTFGYRRGRVGTNIGKLAVGHFNEESRRSDRTSRMFRGLIDEIEIYGSALSLSEIQRVQNIGVISSFTHVNGVSLSPNTAYLNRGATTQLTATILPSNATNQNVIWNSSSNAVATVSSTGLVTGVAEGMAVIKVTTADRGYSATCIVTVTEPSPLTPLVKLGFDEFGASSVRNTGSTQTVHPNFNKTNPPTWSTNVPVDGMGTSIDFGVVDADYYVESPSVIGQLAGLESFTVTGWINNRSSDVGSGGNRIVSWINNSNHGVEIVYTEDGALQVGINEWAEDGLGVSSSGQIPTNSSAPSNNWRFFAVTYKSSNGSLSFYFGSNTTSANLDRTVGYNQGSVGMNIGKLAVGHFNEESRRSDRTSRMFRGLIDDVAIFGSALSQSEIQQVQNIVATTTPRTAVEGGNNIFDLPFISILPLQSAGDGAGESSLRTPLVKLGFNENGGSLVQNTGSTGFFGSVNRNFNKTNPPAWSTNVPVSGGRSSVDFGVDDDDYYVESPSVISELAGLKSFTVTGWVNNRNSDVGSGGNRIVCWMNNSRDGVDIVYTADGALGVGIDEWAEDGPVMSSSGQIPTNSSAPYNNWRFFAVTYKSSSSSLKIYFGSNTTSARLDQTFHYDRGRVGTNIGKLAIGHFNEESMRSTRMSRMFRGLIDEVKIYGSALSLQEIRRVQNTGDGESSFTRVTGVSLSPSTAYLNRGATTQLTAVVSPSNATNQGVYWSSRDKGIATVSSSGLVTGVWKGTTVITATTIDRGYRATCNVTVTEHKPVPQRRLTPLVKLEFNENGGLSVGNTGSTQTVHPNFNKTNPPTWSTNVPVNGGRSSVDFGVDDEDYYVESPFVIGELAGMKSFTVTGWVNNRSSDVGSGGNRIVCWINNSDDGVEIVYTEDGAIQVGINEWAEDCDVLSSPGKIPTNFSAPAYNWRFFAVTYKSSSSSLKIYFGSNTTSARLDQTFHYDRGRVGTNIGKLAIGHFNEESRRSDRTSRMFRGLIDKVAIYGSALTLSEIRQVQNIGGTIPGYPGPGQVKPGIPAFKPVIAIAPNPASRGTEPVNFFVQTNVGLKATITIYNPNSRSIYNENFTIIRHNNLMAYSKFATWNHRNRRGRLVQKGIFLAVIKFNYMNGTEAAVYKEYIGIK